MSTATAPKPMTKKEQAAKERQDAIDALREMLSPGATVYTILRHRAKSGMFRVISLAIISEDHNGKPTIFCIDGRACDVLGYTYNTKHDGIPTGGCGMDMGFHLVYNLSRALFPEGFGEKSEGGIRPRSREHAKQLVKEKKTKFNGRNGDPSGWDNDGGYALNHRWL